MADGDPPVVAEPVVPAAAPVAPAVAPVVEAPAPVVAEQAPVVAAEAPVVAAEAPVVAEAAPAADREPSLFEAAKVPGTEDPPKLDAEGKPIAEEAPKSAEEAPPAAETPPAEPAAPAPVEYKYELPSELVLSDEQKAEFHGLMDTYRADPSNLQPLLDYHNSRLQEFARTFQENQINEWQRAFGETTKAWRKTAMADAEFGGNAFETSMGRVALARDTFMSDHARDTPAWAKDREDMINMMNSTGVGDHPVFLKLMRRVARFISEPHAEEVPVDTRPVPQREGPRGNPLHDNPRSQTFNGRG